ncbi:hypothetical protein PRUB_b0401 [Pseudoalteromonas rubra]|uniref:Uncharacterized protein n=1 Tax=Pseudoalteromonas rubra TaxID=43658 RepID=A0A8T0BZI8_9GAMM|nr:hypothetical protein PRUB_b0401 [Pseudoalteromonas rubra]
MCTPVAACTLVRVFRRIIRLSLASSIAPAGSDAHHLYEI